MKKQESVYSAIDKYVTKGWDKDNDAASIKESWHLLGGFHYYIGGSFVFVDEVTTEDIALYLNYLRGHQGGYHREQRLALKPTEYKEIADKLQQFWKWAADEYRIPNPFIPEDLAETCDRIQPVDGDALQKLIRMLESEMKSAPNMTPSSRLRALRDIALILLMYDAGPRAEELTRVKIEDVDLSNKVILIHDAQNRVRKVPFSENLVPWISEYIQSRYPENPIGSALLFLKDEKGTQMDRSSVHDILEALGQRVGLDNINALQFRAAFAKHYHDTDMLDDQLIELMGIENGQQLRLYIDRMGNKKLAEVRKKHYRILQVIDTTTQSEE